MVVITWYLYLCLAIFIGLHILGFIEDRLRGPDSRFGYNIQLRFTTFNWVVCVLSCPIVNLILACIFLWLLKARHD